MAYINKAPKKADNRVKRGANANIAKLYNSQKWQKLRQAQLMLQPLCQHCLENGKVTAGEEIHHIVPISKGQTLEEQTYLAYNADNIITLCTECHHKVHNKMKRGEV